MPLSILKASPGLYRSTISTLLIFALAAPAWGQQNLRGLDPQLVEQGKSLFLENCAVCHGDNAEGTVENWHQRDADGKLPPPPLNGTAHTWHHPVGGLVHTIKNGTIGIGGSMPAWEGTLTDDQILSIIMWLTTLWPDEIFAAWYQMNNQ